MSKNYRSSDMKDVNLQDEVNQQDENSVELQPSTIGVTVENNIYNDRGTEKKISSKSSISRKEAVHIYKAKVVSWVTIVVCMSLGGAAIIIGFLDHALALFGLGLEIMLDAQSSAVVLWRFKAGKERFYEGNNEAIESKRRRDAAREQEGAKITAGVFILVSVLITAVAIYKLVIYDVNSRDHLEKEKAAAKFEMYYAWPTGVIFLVLAWIKWTLADKLDSDVLKLDALSSFLGAFLALIVGVAGLLESHDGAWMADPIAAILIAVILCFTGIRTWYEASHYAENHRKQVDATE